MKKIITALLITCLNSAVFAEVKNTKDLPGHYYLQGVREVGSELLLGKDGQFQWMMSYGAVDQYAQGTWLVDKGNVLLVSTPAAENPSFRLFTEDEMRIRKPAKAGTWVAIVGIPQVGPTPGVAVKFESKTGKTLTAISDANGDAIVDMPDSEEWMRAGLRGAKSKSDWQWFAIPAERKKDRIAAFANSDESQARPATFEKLQLKIEEKGLRISDQEAMPRGLYTKQ
ncbi:hypothetical protein [Janthinobacterium sp. B9-8]|uniref:hypothetical protein n=1 Tax=Janthinobacterium sp. B9-8 TaxID=1236179 RepID=UPI00069BBD8B|nr:hypothetical protein [Janthinobacterium sp. B9-8]AMC35010.1 hypothetical protein VN23_10505 [Janthinobacterium sp. B9-8]